jgi:hypothetical protein
MLRVDKIALVHTFSRLCDGLFGTSEPIPTFPERETMNLRGDGGDKPSKEVNGREASMNHSIYSADRTTHLKIVVVALIAGIAVAGFAISARMNADDGYTQTARVIKAGKPMAVTSSDAMVVR